MKKVLILMLVVFLGLCGCSEKKDVTSASSGSAQAGESNIKQKVFSFKVEGFTEDKEARWTLEGKSANIKPEQIDIKGLKAAYYGDNAMVTISAEGGVYHKETQDVTLIDDIVGKTSDGAEFMAERATWRAASKKIVSKSSVRMSVPPERKITCKGPFELDLEKNVAYLHNNVKVIDKESEVYADKMTVYIDSKTHSAESIITEGNVRVIHKGDIENIGDMSLGH